MKLFKVVDRAGKSVQGKFYKTKRGAKKLRDELNGGPLQVLNDKGEVVATNDKGYRVAVGPDHWRA